MVREEILDDVSLFFLKKQMEVEGQVIKLMNDVLLQIDDAGLRLLIYTYKLDSMKHEAICQGLVDVISKPSRFSLNQAVLSLLEKHRRLEEDALDSISKLVKKVRNKNVKVLLKELEADEKRHHKSLDSMITMLQSRGEVGFWGVLKNYWEKIIELPSQS